MDAKDKVHNIFALSDYSLIHIFKYVTSTDLYNLSLTCKRFEGLVKEKKLWHKIDARGNPNNREKIKYCIDRINERTTDLLICSDRRDIQILPDSFFSSNICSKLTVLALENQLIRGDLVKVSEYPKTLVELSLRKSFVNSHSTFFKFSNMQMENLKVLILDECGWVETYMLVQMSKYAKLEVLSLYKCKKLSDNDIAYLSLAGCFGFKKLRILDTRFTGLGDQILKTFYKHSTLQELYFQSYISTYMLDKTQRLLEIALGAPANPHSYISEYDDVPDTNLEELRQLFGSHHYRSCNRQNLSNEGTVMYKLVIPNVDADYEVKSVLYESPYGECTCNHDDKYMSGFRNPKTKISETSQDSNEIIRLKNIIIAEKREKYSSYVYALAPKLQMDPYKSKSYICFYEEQGSENNKQIDWINVREPVNLFEIAMFEHADIHSLPSDKILPLDLTAVDYITPPDIILGDLGPEFADYDVADPEPDVVSNESGVESGNDDAEENILKENGNEENIKGDNCVKGHGINPDYEEDNEESESDNHNGIDPANHATNKKSNDNDESSHGRRELPKSKDGNYKGKRLSKRNGVIEINKNKKDPTGNKCKLCGVSISEDENKNHGNTCKDCGGEEKSADFEDNIISFKLQKTNQDNADASSKNIPDPNLPSTSKTHSSPSTPSSSSKRKRDVGTNTPDTKKFKANDREDEPSRNPMYAQLEMGPHNTIYININMLDHDEGDLINVPMGRGLINILRDTKPKAAIKKLSLRGFPRINDYTLGYLTTLKLDLLDVTGTSVSNRAVANFIRENPTCRVLHESACICLPRMHF